MNPAPEKVVTDLCALVGLDSAGLGALDVSETGNALKSSFAVGLAAQASIAAAALAANQVGLVRSGRRQHIRVPRVAAERETTGLFRLNGETPNAWDPYSGLFATADGHVRVHANFAHHRDGALALLGLTADTASPEDMAAALGEWRAQDFEDAAAAGGMVVSRVRTLDEWDAHPHAQANVATPVVRLTRIGDADPRALTALGTGERPLSGLRVLDLTRILAGPTCGRTLAAYGGDVLLINGPHLPNIAHIVDTSRGKRSAFLDLREVTDQQAMHQLLADADVFVQGYRPGGLAELGFAPEALADRHPGIICTSLTAYGTEGPWANRRGFDSLVQTATGFNHAEQIAFGADAPKPMPVQILDFASGFLMAFGTQAAVLRRAREGGSWHVEVSLLHTANWLRRLGRCEPGATTHAGLAEALEPWPCTSGELLAMPHAAEFEHTPALWQLPSVPAGTHRPTWSRVD